jgi:hypothetical protein
MKNFIILNIINFTDITRSGKNRFLWEARPWRGARGAAAQGPKILGAPHQVYVEYRAPFGRASALSKTAPALAPQMERLLWWSWSHFRKYLAKQLHLLD